jgi:hypothetical protein
MMESFWSSMQIELLNRKKWNTRVELANAIFDYIEIFHNRQRRHSALGYLTPTESNYARPEHPTRLRRNTQTSNQTVGQVNLSPIGAADPVTSTLTSDEAADQPAPAVRLATERRESDGRFARR